jgi:uncharacterized protein YcbK (DUF882 family)
MPPPEDFFSRRRFLRTALQVSVGLPLLAAAQRSVSAVSLALNSPALSGAKTLAFEHTHTGESLSIAYAVGDVYIPGSLERVNYFLRDHYTGEVGNVDPALLDLLHELRRECAAEAPFQVISGYRCPTTNENLRQRGRGGVARKSLHMEGRAIDIRLPGLGLGDLRDAARSLKIGGVGYYPSQEFVHVDTGAVRYW